MAIRITYSDHAAANLVDRKITPEWVLRTIENPIWTLDHETDPELQHLFRRIPEKGQRVLHVVFNRNESHVVTAYFDRNMRKRL
jgi:Domain of unknown function (DUF4258)